MLSNLKILFCDQCVNGLVVSFFRLTAFVLRSFAQARPFIFVDQDELKHTKDWIIRNQQQPSGCFAKSGRLIHKGLKVCDTSKLPLSIQNVVYKSTIELLITWLKWGNWEKGFGNNLCPGCKICFQHMFAAWPNWGLSASGTIFPSLARCKCDHSGAV